jgi:hypothetical protein
MRLQLRLGFLLHSLALVVPPQEQLELQDQLQFSQFVLA